MEVIARLEIGRLQCDLSRLKRLEVGAQFWLPPGSGKITLSTQGIRWAKAIVFQDDQVKLAIQEGCVY